MTSPLRRRWVLPDDGVVDDVAVELAATGSRAVPLTRAERRLAAARILAAGGTPWRIASRLHLSCQTAHALAADLRAEAAAKAAAEAAAGALAREDAAA